MAVESCVPSLFSFSVFLLIMICIAFLRLTQEYDLKMYFQLKVKTCRSDREARETSYEWYTDGYKSAIRDFITF